MFDGIFRIPVLNVSSLGIQDHSRFDLFVVVARRSYLAWRRLTRRFRQRQIYQGPRWGHSKAIQRLALSRQTQGRAGRLFSGRGGQDYGLCPQPDQPALRQESVVELSARPLWQSGRQPELARPESVVLLGAAD